MSDAEIFKKINGVYYKVVRKKGNDLTTVVPVVDEYIVKYKIREWSYPKVGKLFAFSSLADAISFYAEHGSENCEIYECVVKRPEEVYQVLHHFLLCSPNLIKLFWEGNDYLKLEGRKDHSFMGIIELLAPPPSVAACSAIMLTNKISEKRIREVTKEIIVHQLEHLDTIERWLK